jgi:hypothetical protein
MMAIIVKRDAKLFVKWFSMNNKIFKKKKQMSNNGKQLKKFCQTTQNER